MSDYKSCPHCEMNKELANHWKKQCFELSSKIAELAVKLSKPPRILAKIEDGQIVDAKVIGEDEDAGS